MHRHLACAACVALFSLYVSSADAQQVAGPGEVVRPKKAESPDGVTVVGCVLPEARPNAFRLILAEGKDNSAPKLPRGLKAGSVLELVARGETNLQPFANQKIEVTGKLTNGKRRLEVTDARPIGTCDPTSPSHF
jgi:hypothetical protein